LPFSTVLQWRRNSIFAGSFRSLGESLAAVSRARRERLILSSFGADRAQVISLTNSHYRILEKLGEGGMGEVYLAEDTRLGRRVALKILPQAFAEDSVRMHRFEQEARSASNLNHPNIVTIYDIGHVDSLHYIAAEFIDGTTLRDHISETEIKPLEAIGIAVQVASALDAAHQAGVVHRDIKPENIMLRRDLIVKVLDFGLAKWVESEMSSADVNAQTKPMGVTQPGAVIGTYVYMSPEQARGLPVDARADIWSLGCVLFEMIAGRPPFSGLTKSDMVAAILEREPAPLSRYSDHVPVELQRIVTKTLAKNRDERYQTVKDLLIDLRRLGQELEFEVRLSRTMQSGDALETGESPSPRSLASDNLTDARATARNTRPTMTRVQTVSSAEYIVTGIRNNKRTFLRIGAVVALLLAASVAGILYFNRNQQRRISSVAVLSFINMAGDPETEYLSDGITESLINSLSQLPELRVMSRSSTFRYKGTNADARDVGRELGVEGVLMGRVHQRADNLSISIELVDARDNTHVWGKQYSRKLTEIFALQDEMARDLSQSLRLRLSGEQEQRLVKRYTDNVEAYQLYLKGRYYWNKRTPDGFKKGLELFQQAIDTDPGYALAFAGLADSYAMLGDYSVLAPREAFPRAEAAATTALKLDDNLAEGHTSLAFVKMAYQWDWAAADHQFRRAIELNPNYATAHQWYASYLVMMGRFDDSIREIRRAQELDPLSRIINANLGLHYYYARKFDESVEQLKRTISLDEGFFVPHQYLGRTYIQKGMHREAIAELERARGLSGNAPEVVASLGHAYAVAGRTADAQKVLAELDEIARERYVLPYFRAAIYTGLGDRDQAFTWLERAFEERHPGLVLINIDPRFDSLRSDPRFTDLIRRLGVAKTS
jgi:eukaryotic-like serine/threonine-protein kinase